MVAAAQPQVNLVARRKQALVRERRIYAKVQFIALAVVIGYVGLLIFMLVVKGIVTVAQNRLQDSIDEQTLLLAQMKPIEEKYLVLMNKLSLAADMIHNRSGVEERIRYLHDSMPEGVVFTSLEMGDNDTTMTVTVEAHDMYRILDYISQIEQEVAQDRYAQVTLDSIGRARTGSYSMSGVYYLPGS